MSIYQKLFKIQQEIGAISKEMDNPFFKSKYFDVNKLIEQLTPHLKKQGLLLLQPIQNGGVFSRLIDTETGETVESGMTLPAIDDPQKMGSAVTYYRRYTLQSLLALQAEDDDGNAAQQKSRAILRPGTKKWIEAVDKVASGGATVEIVKKHYEIDEEVFKAEVLQRQDDATG